MHSLIYFGQQMKEKEFKKGKYRYTLKRNSVKIEELIAFINVEEVKKYCKSCSQYEKIWTCPPKAPAFESIAKKYKSAEILLFYCDASQFVKEKDVNIACYEFLKKESKKYIKEREKKRDGRSIVPYSCDLCSKCKLQKGEKCSKPKRMRFNMTAMGFKVNDLAKELMDHNICWSKAGRDAEYITQVALVLFN